ncbi:hypothetical protein SELMODRAFT_419588 [Selaginella moellendorffii]|uniref:Uncharacterized protein n=1 Tax=Selaginella moellendorffii TaxID=88036 RepID=D8S9F1_SELML|nr:hypothetical protein SELMODRAFT_419588 [Selaginella moellendorffii]
MLFGQKPQGTSFMQNTFANDSRPGPMHRSPPGSGKTSQGLTYLYSPWASGCSATTPYHTKLFTHEATHGGKNCARPHVLTFSPYMCSWPRFSSERLWHTVATFFGRAWRFRDRYPGKVYSIVVPQDLDLFCGLKCELIKMREKLAMAEAWARARLQKQYEDDFFYNYDEWDSFVDLSTLRSSSGECCSISYLLEKWSWLKEQFARIRTSRLLESSTGRWKKAKVTHGGFKTCTRLGKVYIHETRAGTSSSELSCRRSCLDRVVTRNKESIGTAPLNIKVQDGIAKEMLNISVHKNSNQQYIGDCSAPGLGRGLWPRWHRNVGASIKDLWIYKELASHHLQQSSCWYLVFLPQQWTRSKHGRELLMDKIDTKLMRKLKNWKYIVNMWKTLVEAKRPRSRISWFITKYGDIFPSAPTMMDSS